MKSTTYFFSFPNFLAAAFLIVGLAACSSTENLQQSESSENSSDQELSELEALYWDQIEQSRMSFTDADVHFMTGMIAHHAQALIMSRLAPENDASPEIQRLAARIINAQKDEIASMQQWLKDRKQPVPEINIEELDLTIFIDGKQHTAYKDMPGVLSQEQLQELSDAQGDEFDQLFLTYMIEHHSGAVHMVKNLFSTDGAAQDEEAFRLASDIQVDQITEIERMNLMLEQLKDSENRSG